MPLPFTIGTGRTLMWRRRAAQAPTGPVMLVRDQFNTSMNPLVDSAAEPGPGTRDATGALWWIENGALRGGQNAAAWGDSKVVYDGQTRADGVTLWAMVIPIDRDAPLAVGWAASATPTNPTNTGHHWLNNGGYYRVSQPGSQVTLSGISAGTIGSQRTIEYMVGVTLRGTGAFYWISTFAPYAAVTVQSNDPIGIPQYPDARVLWVEDTTTTTPMYPHISAFTANGPIGHFVDDLRVNLITDWATDAGMAVFLDRFTRADNASAAGNGWTAGTGTIGISSNKLYAPVAGYALNESGLPSGDGIFRGKITWPSPNTTNVNFYLRFVNDTNFIRVLNASASNVIRLDRVVANASTTMGSNTKTWTAGQVYEWEVRAKGNQYQVYVDGVVMIDWTADPTSSFLTEQTFGVGLPASSTGARWDDVMVVPHTVTLPTGIQVGDTPHIFTPGSTIATDTFTAADATALNGRTTTTGGKTWTTVGTGWEINTNRARNTNINGATTEYLAYIDAGTTDYEVSADITTPAVDDVIRAGFAVRLTDANNYIQVRLFMDPSQVANDEIEIREYVAGVGGGTTKQNLGNYFATGTTYAMKVQIVGRTMHVYLNGQPIVTSSIYQVVTGSNVGLYHAGNDDGSSFDSFTVKALT